MKRILLAFALVGLLAPSALAASTFTSEWTGTFHNQPRFYVTTQASGNLVVDVTFAVRNKTWVGLSVTKDDDLSVWCGASANATTVPPGVVGCTITDAPAGVYRIVINPATGGKTSGTLTVTGEL